MTSTIEKYLPRVTLAVLLIIMGCFIGFLCWLLWPYQVIVIEEFSVPTTVTPAGAYMVFRMDYCKNPTYAELPGVVQYSFIGSGLTYNVYGQRLSLLAPGCSHVAEAIRVPLLIPPGRYQLEMIRTYRVNPARDVTVRALSNDFEITKRLPPVR